MKEKPSVAPTPEAGKERDVTLKEILADKEKSSLFGESLKLSGNQDIAERLLKGKLAEGDLEKLDDRRKEFNRQQQEHSKEMKDRGNLLKEARETLRNGLTVEALTQFAGKSKQFNMIIKAVGAEGARNIILSQLEALAMRDPGRLKTVLDAFKKFSESSKVKNKPDIEITKICEKYHITEEEFKDILRDNLDRESRQKALEDKINEKIGWWKRKTPTLRKSSESKAGEILSQNENKDELENLKKSYEKDLQMVGDAMGVAISKNEEVQEAFMSVLLGKEITQAQQAPKQEFLSFQEMRGMMPEEDALKQEYTAWAETEKSASRPPDNDAFVNSYMGGKMGEKKSSWSDITKSMIMKLVNGF